MRFILSVAMIFTVAVMTASAQSRSVSRSNSTTVNTSQMQEPQPQGQVQWDAIMHDFGDITQGDKVSYKFKFTNVGQAPISVQKVHVTCGCTATDYPRTPIAPGKTAEIGVTFNSAGKQGKQNKVINVITNAKNNDEKITITCNVIPQVAPKLSE